MRARRNCQRLAQRALNQVVMLVAVFQSSGFDPKPDPCDDLGAVHLPYAGRAIVWSHRISLLPS